MTKIRGARERARGEITTAIKDEARRQLAAEGAAKLSLRAVARELGMVSSALYRYFPGRDDLLTALITDSYDALGGVAEAALEASAAQGDSHLARWQSVCRAVREWALAHPHEYALIYGSPVPGYAAPDSTTGPAARAALVLITIAADAHAAGALRVPGTAEAATGPAHAGTPHVPAAPTSVLQDARELTERLDVDLPAPVMAEMAAAWAQLFGLLSFELFGQFERVIEARDDLFDHAAVSLARGVGLA
ncbi:TetR/AcrR family transcriptional regulator [Streptomyces albidus (ex Kaewkla and Franco 2022)]|uniref:TetR/AcrR family transcriptional regulator n=1 Tax=Streptomyces albidus (ex Kaewkla and Franco 2022) TaxID=722709 RepID=UPI0015EEDA40|nr:TetR/AcrR family transcriptional regulator [Streptomyces albidus (ex Kaewkla and Franco 2022)]